MIRHEVLRGIMTRKITSQHRTCHVVRCSKKSCHLVTPYQTSRDFTTSHETS